MALASRSALTRFTRSEREIRIATLKEQVKKDNNLEAALTLVILFKEDGNYSSALHWIYTAGTIAINNKARLSTETLSELLSGIDEIDIMYLFDPDIKGTDWLIDAISVCPTITTIFGSNDFDPEYINERFCKFLKTATNITSLNLSAASATFFMKISHLHIIAEGLRFNSSVKKLSLKYQNISDEGLKVIVSALSANPKTKIEVLDFSGDTFHSGITTEGAGYLLDLIYRLPTLRFVCLEGNNRCRKEVQEMITQTLNDRNALNAIVFHKCDTGSSSREVHHTPS